MLIWILVEENGEPRAVSQPIDLETFVSVNPDFTVLGILDAIRRHRKYRGYYFEVMTDEDEYEQSNTVHLDPHDKIVMGSIR